MTSLLPDQILLGLCSSFLSEDTIPDSSPYSARELTPHSPEPSNQTWDNLGMRKWNENNSNTPNSPSPESGYWTNQPQEAIFQSPTLHNLELVQSAPHFPQTLVTWVLVGAEEGRKRVQD